MCKILAKNINLVVGARQSFQFFRQITWFLGNNTALSEFRYQSLKTNFILTTRATKSILKKCSRFCHSFSNVSGFLSHSFLHNHIAATLSFFFFFLQLKMAFLLGNSTVSITVLKISWAELPRNA